MLFSCCALAHAAGAGKSVLFIVTSGTQVVVNGNKVSLGYWGEELASPLKVLEDAGVSVSFASPDGTTLLDPLSVNNPQWVSPAVDALVKKTDARLKAFPVQKLKDVKTAGYDAVLVVGGHGAMFDLNRNPQTIRILRQMHKNGKIVAAECHGTASLAFAGLIKGVPVTGFPAVWEAAELKPVLPYSLEDEMNKASGGKYQSGLKDGQPPQPLAITSGRIITSRDPMSSEAMGRALLAALRK